EGRLGRLDQRLAVTRVTREGRDPCRDADASAGDARERRDAILDALRHDDASGTRCHEDELVSPDASHGVDKPDRLRQDGRDATQDVVSGTTVGRVGRAEVVDVEQCEGYLATLPAGAGKLQLEDASDGALIRDTGQRVCRSHPLE